MDKQDEQLQALTEIRSIMDHSTRFISLSGLSGVFSGIFALIGAALAYLHFNRFNGIASPWYDLLLRNEPDKNDLYSFIYVDALLVLVASLTMGCILTIRKSKNEGQPYWNSAARRMLLNLFIPLVTGGLFCLILLRHNLFGLVAPATLIFYGLALLNASKYTLNDIRYLGICEIILGLLASVYVGYGLFFWAAGFGILHIIYGLVMYTKYER